MYKHEKYKVDRIILPIVKIICKHIYIYRERKSEREREREREIERERLKCGLHIFIGKHFIIVVFSNICTKYESEFLKQ